MGKAEPELAVSKFIGGPLNGKECGEQPRFCLLDWKDEGGSIHHYSIIDGDGAAAVYDPGHEKLREAIREMARSAAEQAD